MTDRIAAVLFDLDGTLVATMDPWDRCWTDYAADHGHTWTDADRTRTHGHGDWARYLAAVCGLDSPDRVTEDCVDLMLDRIDAGQIPLLPGVPTLLATATTHVPTGVVSASPRRFVHATLAHFGLADTLSVIVAREDHPDTKPHPAPWLHAATLLGVRPESCVAVEDSAHGIRSAHAAGMRVFAIPSWPATRRPPESDLAHHLAPTAARATLWLHGALTEMTPAR
ncbi:HAD family hydrolase [Nocardia jejuensis]|uniref:HAD family hydrolase n=1 Tax=Nocardia jejuensis TaxID=328049 RepID=UPI00082B894F|nr:HAD family phosphatase [Nocardia jejuensis]